MWNYIVDIFWCLLIIFIYYEYCKLRFVEKRCSTKAAKKLVCSTEFSLDSFLTQPKTRILESNYKDSTVLLNFETSASNAYDF